MSERKHSVRNLPARKSYRFGCLGHLPGIWIVLAGLLDVQSWQNRLRASGS